MLPATHRITSGLIMQMAFLRRNTALE